ncbi:MAG: WecB/TagA/CpsF family glycosyltransferase [Rhodobacteraceae bacterium]|nr:WecB/TagA/CpsF family glycosyltransferase [Paracoccaceae bacterium]
MTQLSTLSLFGFDFVNESQNTAIEALLNGHSVKTVAFANAHCLNMAFLNKTYASVLRESDMLLPDGSGVSIAAKMAGQRFVTNLNGTDLFLPLCKAAAAKGNSIYLLGSAKGVAEKAASKAKKLFPNLKIAGQQHGYFPQTDTNAIIENINASGADILLVALGVPMQELWISKHRNALSPALVMGVGAMLDFHAGRVSRAPLFLRKLGLEWTWRLAIEPTRMAKRYLLGNPAFLVGATVHGLKRRLRLFDRVPPVKRMFDLICVSLGLLVLAPLFLLIGLAIKLSSKGPVFFRQTRVGYQGEHFNIYKFRSMHLNAEMHRADLLKKSDRKGVCFKLKNDPRITPIGRLLRRTSMDELPQLLNILKGEMSLVGPRPALPEEVEAYSDRALLRLNVAPGITGIWQISGRAEIDFNRMVEMDIAYSRTHSVMLDFFLIILTARAVISGRGAF